MKKYISNIVFLIIVLAFSNDLLRELSYNLSFNYDPLLLTILSYTGMIFIYLNFIWSIIRNYKKTEDPIKSFILIPLLKFISIYITFLILSIIYNSMFSIDLIIGLLNASISIFIPGRVVFPNIVDLILFMIIFSTISPILISFIKLNDSNKKKTYVIEEFNQENYKKLIMNLKEMKDNIFDMEVYNKYIEVYDKILIEKVDETYRFKKLSELKNIMQEHFDDMKLNSLSLDKKKKTIKNTIYKLEKI
ncbi:MULTISPECIES: hypothetical protein [Oceanotoga]|jgi:hypothetical protein|uniref:Uncharacterized protein n=1 Tax=Oceanotoga teriensis TaxID=515440 RepID=A0AA45HIP5_9BACT|nr:MULTISPECIES: hypothetical protein [Oceanotoga]MDN5342558.1 hypothetical protein [Oceanotoga sp.]MDO7977054.1 hypothetical protein [Oceanotoga teriensis]PWJ92170.1 hypothetical protein C7380_10953 [Oceanotoga teriensis]